MKFLSLIFFHFPLLIFSQSSSLIDSLKNELRSSPDSIRQILLTDLSWEYSFSNIDSAEYFGLKAEVLAKERNNADDLARAKSMLAIVYDINGNVRKAANLYVEVATYYDSKGNKAELSKAYNNLGVLFFYNEELHKSEEYFLKSRKLDEELGDRQGVANSLINLAAIANRFSNYETAFEYLIEAKKIATELEQNDAIIASINYELASTFTFVNAHDSSLKYYQKLLPYHEKTNDLHSALFCYNGIISAYFSLNNIDSALFYFSKSQIVAESYDDIGLSRARNRLGSQLYAASYDFENAYNFLLNFVADNDSMTNDSRITIINELEEKYQSEQKEIEIAQLQIQQQKSENQRNMLLFVAALVVLAAIFLFTLLKSKSKANKIIAKSLTEKETLLKEIHHRVKNNLQIVSSLLSMQSRFITDKTALGAVNEGQARVESMALIHQKLYQENNLSGVNAKEYIEDLAEILKQSYSTDSEIEFEYDIDNLMIDVDTIIPIGLILNELICNSLKHAFPDAAEGTIKVVLKEIDNILQLEVRDDGIGSLAETSDKSFGKVLIESLSMKLKATLLISSDNGMSTTLNISKYKLV